MIFSRGLSQNKKQQIQVNKTYDFEKTDIETANKPFTQKEAL
jgi:hypothetical protein